MATGTTFDFNIGRNDLITLAHQEVNMLEIDQPLDPARLLWGIKRLNIILRRLDAEKKHVWTVSPTPTTLAIVANTFSYTSANGLPANIKRLVGVVFRNGPGQDTSLRIHTPETYLELRNKFDTGDPTSVLLSEHRDVGSQTLLIHPAPSTVNTASEVTGSDALNYTAIRSHQSVALNKPITGADYLLYWEQTGSSGSAWVTATDYTAPEHLRLWYERPLFDFDSSTDNPDVPNEWIEPLLYELVEAISNGGAMSVDDRVYYTKKTEKSREKIKPSQTHFSNNARNKTQYF